MIRIPTQNHRHVGHGLFNLPDEFGIDILIRMRHFHRTAQDLPPRTPFSAFDAWTSASGLTQGAVSIVLACGVGEIYGPQVLGSPPFPRGSR